MNGTAAPTARAAAQGSNTRPSQGPRCDHCGLAVSAGLVDAQASVQFCCGGCRAAYQMIHGAGLAAFYRLRDQKGGGAAPVSGTRRYAAYDSEAFLARHADHSADGLRGVELRLEGVHCAACVWLVERLPRVVPGVIDARLSLVSGCARVVWDPQRTRLSSVAETLARLGYSPHPARGGEARRARQHEERRRLARMAVAGALAGNCMLIAVALYAGALEGMEPRFVRYFRWVSMGLGLLSMAWPGAVFFRGAAAALRARTPSLDAPIALALAIGSVAGAYNTIADRGDVYFDSLSVLVFLLLVGRFVQARQQRWAEDAVGLALSTTPDSCRIVRGDGLIEDSIEALVVGDEVEVWSGELLPADGVVTSGESAIDPSLLTGESAPRPVRVGDEVCAGTQNAGSTLRVRVSACGDSTRVARLMRLVSESLAEKPPIVALADRVGGWFVAVVSTIAVANLAGWCLLRSVAEGVDSTVALLIVACPCALGLATPLTMSIAVGRAAKLGGLVKSAAALERLAGRGLLLLDKTGTLTTGAMRVVRWDGDASLRSLVASVEADSCHPVARALSTGFLPEELAPSGVSERVERHGLGVAARTLRGALLIGSPRLMREEGVSIPDGLAASLAEGERQGATVVLAAIDGAARAAVWLRDEPRDDSAATLGWLLERGWRARILSGDAPGPVSAVARARGVAPRDAIARLSPEEKLAAVRRATSERPDARDAVVMIGDGVNDAAALAAADVGVAVHGGAEASLAAADVYLTRPGLGALADLVGVARRTRSVVRRNLAISLAYNGAAVGLAAAGWITPLVAAVLMPLSSASVLVSAIGGLAGGRPLAAAKNSAADGRSG